MNEPSTSAKLTREIKLLFLKSLKSDSLTAEQANEIQTFLKASGLIQFTSIIFRNYNPEEDGD